MSKKMNRKPRTMADVIVITIIVGMLLGLIASGAESGDKPTGSKPVFAYNDQYYNKVETNLIADTSLNNEGLSYSDVYIDNRTMDKLLEQHKHEDERKTVTSSISSVDSGWRTFEVTAYTAGKESTGKTSDDPLYGVTASGNIVKNSYTIACPPSMDFGTSIYIKHFDNTFVCEDRGSHITQGRLDVYMSNLDRALEFGRRQLKIKVVD